MRAPSHPLAEGLAYVVIAVLAMLVILNASRPSRDPVSPDGVFREASR